MVGRDNEEYSREMLEWADLFQKETGNEVEVLDPDSIDGEIFARSHEVMAYPTLCVVDNSSSMLAMWAQKYPQFDEVTYVIRSV